MDALLAHGLRATTLLNGDRHVDVLGHVMRRYRETYGDVPRAMHAWRPQIECGPPGTPWDQKRFRSQWEERTAAALTRLGIRWAYEQRAFDWVDSGGRWHRYTPDFELLDLHMTFAEVKGPAGAYGDDQFKMAQVLDSHRYLTLLLWDADTVEALEDMDSSAQFISFLTTTKLAA